MDEKKLAELLKEAVADAPPPTFTQDDVARESERQRVRRRNGLLGGSAFGVAVLAGATALAVALWTGPGSTSQPLSANDAASAGNGNAAPNEVPNEGDGGAAQTERGSAKELPPETPKQGGYPEGNGGPAGPTGTPSGCEQVDRGLAAALAGELPDTANLVAVDAVPPTSCPADAKGAMFNLPDGGQLIVLLVSGNVAMSAESGPAGALQADALTDDGASVYVLSVPSDAGGSPPYAADLTRYARDIAGQY
jgi:hypothetical protein